MTTPTEPVKNADNTAGSTASPPAVGWARWQAHARLGWTRARQLIRHLWLDAADSERAISPEALSRITARVTSSEQGHTGQVRICIEAALPLSYLRRVGLRGRIEPVVRERALMMFSKLRVWDTGHNNGLLIYVLLAEQAIEIVADRGLAERVPAAQWDQLMHQLSSEFGDAHFEQGLADAIDVCSALLVQHFPRPPHSSAAGGFPNTNELPDEPSLR